MLDFYFNKFSKRLPLSSIQQHILASNVPLTFHIGFEVLLWHFSGKFCKKAERVTYTLNIRCCSGVSFGDLENHSISSLRSAQLLRK